MTRRAGMALALMCLLGVGACDWFGPHPSGPARLGQTPLDARALSGSVLPQEMMAAVTAPRPVMAAAGEILVGAQVEEHLADAARDLRLGPEAERAVRERGFVGLDDLPPEFAAQVRLHAEAAASEEAVRDARVLIERLGLSGGVSAGPGGVVTITLAHEAIPASEAAGPEAMVWTGADACPHFMTQDELERDLALATRCTMKALAGSHRFAFVEPNYIATTSAAPPSVAVPPNLVAQAGGANDPLLALQWNFRARGTGPGFSPGGAGFTAFWAAHHTGSRQIRVAVVDTGLDGANPDIRGSANLGGGIDVISDPLRAGDGDGADADAQDAGDACNSGDAPSYHGTHVAGIIGAGVTNNRVGVAGGAWEVTIIPVRALGRCGGALADIVTGVNWAAGLPFVANGVVLVSAAPADIVNLSFSLEAPCPAALQIAINAASARGALIVAAAGDGADQARNYTPANCRNVIVVGASDAKGDLAFYSNFGPEIDLVAPGGDMFADADRDGWPDGVLSTRTTQAGCTDPLNRSAAPHCYYSFMQGASMAAPHVSAALALLAAETGLRGAKLREALLTLAVSPFPAGFGRIACARVHNAPPVGGGVCARQSGRGYLDLARAVGSSH